MSVIRKIHFLFGILVLLTFLGTGQFMHLSMDHLVGMEPIERALLRTGHIYILLFGLVHLSLGAYLQFNGGRVMRWLQLTGSIVLFIATGIVIVSFFVELPTDQIERPLSRLSIYLMLSGVLMHALGSRKIKI